MSDTNWRVHPRPNPRGGEWEAVIIAGPEAGGVVICEANLVAAEQIVRLATERNAARDALAMAEEREQEMVVARGIAATEINELRLEIAAMRGRKEGRISDRWTWRDDRWEMDAPNCVASVSVRFGAWMKGTGGATVPVNSIRAGMRQCEAWSAGGAS